MNLAVCLGGGRDLTPVIASIRAELETKLDVPNVPAPPPPPVAAR